MKEGWEYKKLKEVGLTQTGTTPSKQIKAYYGGDIPFIRPAELNIDQNGGVQYDSELKLTEEGALKSRVINANSVLMCCIGSVGKTGYTLNNVTCNQQINTLTPYDNYNPRFVYYALISPFFQQEVIKIANSAKATLPIISKGKWEILSIPIPPLSKQQSIVDYLDSAFAKIDAMKANAEKALNEAKALFQSSLKEMLEPKEGWEEKTLGEMSEIQSGFAFKSTQFQKRGEFQVIRMGNVRPGVIRYNESPVFIDSVDKNTIEKALLKVGDMIITQTGSRNKRDYGFTVLIDKEKLLLNQRIARIRVINTITNKYLLYYSWTDYFRDQYFANEGGTVGQGNVGIDAIRYAVISHPPLSEQQRIVATLDSLKSKVDRLQANYDKISQECDALKQAILRQVFE